MSAEIYQIITRSFAVAMEECKSDDYYWGVRNAACEMHARLATYYPDEDLPPLPEFLKDCEIQP